MNHNLKEFIEALVFCVLMTLLAILYCAITPDDTYPDYEEVEVVE